MNEKNFILFDKKEMYLISKGLFLLLKENKKSIQFDEVLELLNKVNTQIGASLNDEKEKGSGYVSVKYEDEHWPKTFGGREYSYHTELPLEVDDIVEAPTKYGTCYAKVTRVNIPEEEIEDVKPYIKEITRKLDKVRFIYYSEIKDAAA